ncbi:RCC1 domain-containing protein [Salinispora arenicola]|uniref:RCC1 domain-containing protein n=1 Tax=Salinispora arenicola TaxID=168697 RepID=UPI0003726457|nr:regulator of chromosome condensation RCC1 [Salinispora arenicola]
MSPAVAQNEPAVASDASDTVLAWGDNKDGELGDGTTTDSSTPVAVDLPADTTVTAIAAGNDHSLAVTSSGTALAWGDNRFGQLGDESTTDSITPVEVSLPAGTTVTAIAAGDDHSYAVTSSGTALAWGDNGQGELGDGTTTRSSTPIPVSLPAGTTVTAVAGGIGHGLAVTSTGTVLAWGLNSDGQLGDGTITDSSTPVAVDLPADTTVTAVAAGRRHSLAVTSTGTVLAWGLNSDGQLGDGTITDSSTPVAVDLPADTTVTAVAAGRRHSLAVTSTGTVLAWGSNSDGRLGDGTTTDSNTPVEVSLPAGTTITAATAGVSHSMALVAPPPGSTAPPDLPTTGSASLPITLTTATLLILTGATFIHLAHQHRSTRRLR